MCDRYPHYFSTYECRKSASGHGEWNNYDEDPFQPLPVRARKGSQAPYPLPPAEGVVLSDDDINLMLPLLLNNQDAEENAKEDIGNGSCIAKKNEPAPSSLYCQKKSTAPKNVRSGRPAKRPLDGYSAFVRDERTRIISSHNHGADLHEAKAYLSTLNKKIKDFNSTRPTISSLGVTEHDDGGLTKPYPKDHAAPETDLSYVKSGLVPLANKSSPTADPLLYDVLQTYRTLEHLPTTASGEPVQPSRRRKTLDFPHPQWHWHDASKPLCIPPPEFVSVKDSNGTPQAFKIVYASITMPYDMANKFDPVALYESTKGTIESLINNNKLNAGG